MVTSVFLVGPFCSCVIEMLLYSPISPCTCLKNASIEWGAKASIRIQLSAGRRIIDIIDVLQYRLASVLFKWSSVFFVALLLLLLLLLLCRVDVGLKVEPTSPSLLFTRAKVLWEDPQQDKARAYSALLQVRMKLRRWWWCYCFSPVQAAKADSRNPDVFLYLGHYQKLVTRDLK